MGSVVRRHVTVVLAVSISIACGEPYAEGPGPSEADGGGADASSDAASSDATKASLTSRPGVVECGPDLSCTIADSYCCISDDGTGNPMYACKEKESDCNANRASCDESADCAPNEKCCASISIGTFTAACGSQACSTGQSCRTDAECGGRKCIKQQCFALVSYVCGLQPFCNPL